MIKLYNLREVDELIFFDIDANKNNSIQFSLIGFGGRWDGDLTAKQILAKQDCFLTLIWTDYLLQRIEMRVKRNAAHFSSL